MKVTFTLWQRLNLEGVMQQQRQVDGRDYLALVDLWRKIAVPDSIRKDYAGNVCGACGAPRGGSIWDREKIELAAPLEIEVEKGEARVALDICTAYKKTVTDSEWWFPMKRDLQAVTGDENPTAAAPASPANRPGRHRPGSN